ncbi:hypothetical protein Ccrd_023066 [Cynara cardunculus var. scolymus]|uniref:Uncharacterized protein n=1 Tax=Cynara cardunculus var. scolymus TaxID=59895 RepID=A0A103XXH4_CYNCS|nr:hypothetical protein Ccrd_023066 [Cynara cardunculus var. scolymus]
MVFASQGVGKTTLIARVLETLRISDPNLKIQGFLTRNALSLYQFNHTINLRGNLEYNLASAEIQKNKFSIFV